MVAQHGHRVLGIDISKTGIRQMLEDARREDLEIVGVVADIAEYEIGESYDVVILDRVLHLFEENARIRVLRRALPQVDPMASC